MKHGKTHMRANNMEEMTLQEIREDSKRRFYNAIDSRSVKIIESVIQWCRNREYDIMHKPEIAQSEGAYEVVNMLSILEQTLDHHRFILKNY